MSRDTVRFTLAVAVGLVPLLLATSAVYAACLVYAVVGSVPVGSAPFGVAVDPNADRVYVTNILGDSVSVLDGTALDVIATVSVPRPGGVALNPNTNRIYVANESAGSVSVIDGASYTAVSIPVGGLLQPIAVNPTTNRIYVVDSVGRISQQPPDSTVYVIDGATNAVAAAIPVGKFSLDVAVNPTSNRVYVANTDSSTISVIDGATNTVVDAIAVTSPVALGVSLAANRIYVAHSTAGGSRLSVIDGATDTILATVPAPGASTTGAVAVDDARSRVYLSSISYNTISVFDGSSTAFLAAIPLDPIAGAGGVGVDPTTNRIYVAEERLNRVAAIGAVTPDQAVQLLMARVNRLVASGDLSQSDANALDVTLSVVQQKLSAGDSQGALAALKLLDNAFINKVQALVTSGRLAQMQGQALIDGANSLISQLNC